MNEYDRTVDRSDRFDLNRFLVAQKTIYDRVLRELKNGYKRSHWIWFVFPQLDGLARSSTSQHYAIKSIEETLAYYNHPVLGSRLLECSNMVNRIEGKTISEIFGYPDDLKLKSSMTLFAEVTSDRLFSSVLEKYFLGERDAKTIQLLKQF